MMGLLAIAAVLVAPACSAAPEAPVAREEIVRVPLDASLSEAGARVADGGIILISPGVYRETLEVRANDVTVRGLDRNGVVLDGEFTRANGIVASGARVAIENLTVQNFLQNGVLVTGVTDENGAGIARGPEGYLPEQVPPPVPGYLVQYVTALNNGLYGIYAFNRTGGAIRENLASGSSDSGVYVGQCESCGALVERNVLVSNAVGMEFANASDVVVTGNRIVSNRIGISVLSNYLEAHGPSRGVRIVGNVISENNAVATPEQASGAFGIGIGLGGTRDALVVSNRIEGNGAVGVWIVSSEDFAPVGNRLAGNLFGGGALDVAFAPSARAVGSDNCFELAEGARTEPAALGGQPCDAANTAGSFALAAAPSGIAFSKVPHPEPRAGLSSIDEAPRKVPDAVSLPALDGVAVPSADHLLDGGVR